MEDLIQSVKDCTLCSDLPLGPRPILQGSENAPILIAGQAPGRKTHAKGIPFDDPSGNRLRDWLGVSREEFYDPTKFAVIPMGFCYPGTGKGGDLPPRPLCAEKWRHPLMSSLKNLQLTLVICMYAQDWHMKGLQEKTLTATVANWRTFWPDTLPLPHPSPRNIRWFQANPWFGEDVLPLLKERVRSLIGPAPK